MSRKLTDKTLVPESVRFMYEAKILSRIDFSNEWSGWKMRGRFLVSPHGDRISPERLLGLLFIESRRKPVKVAREPGGRQHVAQVIDLAAFRTVGATPLR